VSEPTLNDPVQALEPVHAEQAEAERDRWTQGLIVFLRVMAALSMLKGLYHWSAVCGIGAPRQGGFIFHTLAWQTATVFFAVIDLVAAVGLWLAAAWGAVVWLTATVSMVVVQLFFPQIYGANVWLVLVEIVLVGCYLLLAIKSARERPA
jgi:uncharacterized membrane protein (DUF2068 family)